MLFSKIAQISKFSNRIVSPFSSLDEEKSISAPGVSTMSESPGQKTQSGGKNGNRDEKGRHVMHNETRGVFAKNG